MTMGKCNKPFTTVILPKLARVGLETNRGCFRLFFTHSSTELKLLPITVVAE